MRNFLVMLGLATSGSAFAQDAAHHAHGSGYAGMQTREIKAFTAEQVADLREGRGMGASLPAELNGVPGPLHVLQLSQQLKVAPDQMVALERITADMRASAQQLGAQLIAAEAELDQSFKSGSIDEQGIERATERIASLQGRLRAVHLSAHLRTQRILSNEQVAAYNIARGYAPAPGHPGRH